MGLPERLGSVVEILLSDRPSLLLAVTALLTISAPFADRYVIRRKRLHYRVQYNSKIGLSPVNLRDDRDSVKHADTQLLPIVELLDRMSIVVIRIRNTGVEDIGGDDFDAPLEFTFGGRVVWNARISEPSVEPHRKKLKDSLEFFTLDGPGDPEKGSDLANVRVSLSRRLTAWLRLTQADNRAARPERIEPSAPRWHGVRLRDLPLQRGEQFKLVVVLREPDENTGTETTKEIECSGRLSGGPTVDEKKQRRFTWPRITAAIGVVLSCVLVTTVLAGVSRPAPRAGEVPCAEGTLRIVGSSAFSPVMRTIADEYTDSCGELARIDTEATGSIRGVRQLATAGENGTEDERTELAALSDGRTGVATPELTAQPVAVVVYAVVVNDSVGIDRLTLDEIRGIYRGDYRDWNELRPGPSSPIRLVGRGQESGSRRTFESTVLGTSAGRLTSDSCEEADRGGAATTIRCERGTEAEVIEEVSTTEGALAYIDLPSAIEAKTEGRPLTLVSLGDHYPDADTVEHGYPFWTIEYLYTRGVPEEGSVLDSFVDYLRSGTARAELRDAGYPPCVTKDGSLHPLCRR